MATETQRHIRAFCRIWIREQDVTQKFDPYLMRVRVVDKELASDECHIELDDAYGRLRLPDDREPIRIGLGWQSDAVYTSFEGTVDDVVHHGQKRQGRLLTIVGTGVDFLTKSKQHIQMSFEEKKKDEGVPLSDVLRALAARANIPEIVIDPKFEGIKLPSYVVDESPNNAFLRLARDFGGIVKYAMKDGQQIVSFTDKASEKNALGQTMPTVFAVAGGNNANLIGWNIHPRASRAQWSETSAQWFSRTAAAWERHVNKVPVGGGGWFSQLDTRHTNGSQSSTEKEAESKAGADASGSLRRRGYGWVAIDGDPKAQAGSRVDVRGIRSGVDGSYKITEAEHTYHKGGGYTTLLTIEDPVLSGNITGEFPEPKSGT
jgi:phage protein D